MDGSTLGFPVLHHLPQSLPKFMPTELVMSSNHLILWYPLLLLPSIFPRIRVFSNESVPHIRWPKYWSFNFSISSSSEYSGLIFLRIDWFKLLVVQGTLKTLLQHHSSKASILQCSALFMVQLTHDCWKNHSLDYTGLGRQVTSLLFDTVYVCQSFSSKEQASLNFMVAVTICSNFGVQENNVCHCFLLLTR